MAVSTTGDSSQSSQELFDPHTVHRLSRHEDSDFSFEGFPDPQTGSEAVLLGSDLPLRSSPSAVSRGDVFGVVSGSRCQTLHAVTSAEAESGGGTPG